MKLKEGTTGDIIVITKYNTLINLTFRIQILTHYFLLRNILQVLHNFSTDNSLQISLISPK